MLWPELPSSLESTVMLGNERNTKYYFTIHHALNRNDSCSTPCQMITSARELDCCVQTLGCECNLFGNYIFKPD